jgi:hypothetical protein
MAYVLLGILVLGLFASFFIAYMSSQTWPIYQTVLVVFVFIGALVFFYLGARTLATHKNWRNQYNRNREQVAQLEAQILPLTGGVEKQGTGLEGDIPRLKHELALAINARSGGVYYSVKAASQQNGVLQLTLSPPGTLPPPPKALPTAAGEAPAGGEVPAEGEAPVEAAAEQPPAEAPPADQPPAAAPGTDGAAPAEPVKFAHALVPNTVLFVFDQKSVADGGRYLGEFKVVEATADNPSVKIEPNLPLTESQAKRLETSVPGSLVLYTTMPPDNGLVFSKLAPAARQALLPPSVVEEYAKADRALRDYHAFFHENYVQRGLLADTIAQTTSNVQRIEAAAAETNKEAAFGEGEKVGLQSDLAKFQAEVKAIAAYEQSLKQLLAQVGTQLKATYLENRRAAESLTRAQLEAADEINRRSSVAVQAPG